MKNLLISTLFLLSACTPIATQKSPRSTQSNQIGSHNYEEMNKKHQELLSQGKKFLANGERKKSIFNCFNPIIKDYENIYRNTSKRLYSARTKAEHDFYLMATHLNQLEKIHVLSEMWSLAYYLKAYALLELQEIDLAQKTMAKALKLSPSNAKYLSEMGHIYHLKKEVKKSLQNYLLAEKAVALLSPNTLKKSELLRAKRGIGFSFIELKDLKSAERVYREILAINSKDKIARKELKYIQAIKKSR